MQDSQASELPHLLDKERQIARAWRLHRGDSPRVPALARGRAKAFLAALKSEGERVRAAYESIPFRRLLKDWCCKKGVGRERALQKIERAIAPAVVDASQDTLHIAWIEAHGQNILVDDPSFRQDCAIVVTARVAHRFRNARPQTTLTLEASEHGLARMFERGSAAVDARAALYEAAAHFRDGDPAHVESARTQGATVYLPAGEGLFLCHAIKAIDPGDQEQLFARASTWIHHEMAEPHQVPLPTAAEDSAGTALAARAWGSPAPVSEAGAVIPARAR